MRDVIIACDFENKEQLNEFLKDFEGLNPFLKIGMQLFYSEGPALIKELKEKGFMIFLDLKLHDIPNTVKKAMVQIAKLGVDIVNVHAAGTIRMMKAALEGLAEGSSGKRPLCVAVTQLTSTDNDMMNNELCIKGTMAEVVKKYAENTKEAGLDGVVCSPLEAPIIAELGLLSITPGIRFQTDNANDQIRVTTPEKAKELKSSFIVVGRTITKSSNPRAAYLRCVKEFV